MRNSITKRIIVYILQIIPDILYTSIQYFVHFHKFPNLQNPTTYAEKLQWLKLHDRNPEYTLLVDKYRVKEHVAKIIGKEHIVTTLGVWNSPNDIDFSSLPNQFVLKWNHDSGSIIICKDKYNLNINDVKKRLRFGKWINGYLYGREWPYKNVEPCIIAEELLDSISNNIKDFKFYCFDGKPKFIVAIADRFDSPKYSFYDMDFLHIPLSDNTPFVQKDCFDKPSCFEEMKNMASKLAIGHTHIRVDFMEVKEQFYFSELTFYDNSGYTLFNPDKYNYIIGSWLQLPQKTHHKK